MSEYPQRDSSQAHNYGQQYNQNEQPPIQQQPLDPRQQAINEFVVSIFGQLFSRTQFKN